MPRTTPLAVLLVLAIASNLVAERNATIKPALGKPGAVQVTESFDKDLAAPMSAVKGEWKVSDGVLTAKELSADKHAAVLNYQLPNRNSIVRFSFKLSGSTQGLSFSLNHAAGHLFRVVVTPSELAINLDKDKNDPDSKAIVLDKAKAQFDQDNWHTLQIEMLDDSVVAQSDNGAMAKAQHASLDTDKPNYRFVMKGDSLSIDDLSIAKLSAKKEASNSPLAQIEDVEGLPRVLIIGDSISIGYTLPVREALQGKANVHRPATNCGPTTNGLANLDSWLGEKPWDVIHFNWGLHDLKYMGPEGQNLADPEKPTSHQQVPPAEYEKNLRQLVERLKKTGAKLIWRNTTPVPVGSAGRVVGDSAKYNAIAEKIMQENAIETHDMYAFVLPRKDEVMLKANVHFTKEGYDALAKDVAAIVMKALPAK